MAELNSKSKGAIQTVSNALGSGPKMGVHGDKKTGSRAEIDTSAPFESVKEATSRFGGMGFWRPSAATSTSPFNLSSDATSESSVVIDLANVEKQTAQLQEDLAVKERQTLEVLKELETTKMTGEKLKLKLKKEASDSVALGAIFDGANLYPTTDLAERESQVKITSNEGTAGGLVLCPSTPPGFILSELKQAKLNLNRTTNDLLDIQATVESYNRKLEKEKISLQKTRQKLSLNSLNIHSLQEELSQMEQIMHLIKYAEGKGSPYDTLDMMREIQNLSSETEQFKKVKEAAMSEALRIMSEIEQTKASIKTAQFKLVAAKKMKDAARATEAATLADIKALRIYENLPVPSNVNHEGVILTFEDYSSLISKAKEAEEACQKRVVDAMLVIDECNDSKAEISSMVEEATEEVRSSKKSLEEALSRVDAANREKLAVEEALRKWRSDRGQRGRSIHSSIKFKNSYPSLHRKDSHMLDVNGVSLVNHELKPVLNPTLSIGQILSRKLLLAGELESESQAEKNTGTQKVSLGQMLGKPTGDILSAVKGNKGNGNKQLSSKRKKYGLAQISLLMTKRSKQKKENVSLRCRSM